MNASTGINTLHKAKINQFFLNIYNSPTNFCKQSVTNLMSIRFLAQDQIQLQGKIWRMLNTSLLGFNNIQEQSEWFKCCIMNATIVVLSESKIILLDDCSLLEFRIILTHDTIITKIELKCSIFLLTFLYQSKLSHSTYACDT